MKLLQKLIKATVNSGSNSHCKFLRQIPVSVDITQSIEVWKQFDTYKIGTTTNSQSTMHRLAHTPITIDRFDFSHCDPQMRELVKDHWEVLLDFLEHLRLKFVETKDRRYWDELLRLLPESWLQTRHWTGNYQVLRTAYFDRRNHKLPDWSEDFVGFIEQLPYAKELIMYEGD